MKLGLFWLAILGLFLATLYAFFTYLWSSIWLTASM
jgi:hypothetical protein